MNKALIFGARMRAKATKVATLEESIEDLNKRSALEAEKLERAETEEEVSAVEESLEKLQTELAAKEAEKAELEKEIEELQKQIDEQNSKSPDAGERGGKQKMEKREAIVAYVRSMGQKREGVKTTNVGALIPKEVLSPQKERERQIPLLNLIHTVKVTSGSGTYPVLKKSHRKMTEVGELEENPELGKTRAIDVDYKI